MDSALTAFRRQDGATDCDATLRLLPPDLTDLLDLAERRDERRRLSWSSQQCSRCMAKGLFDCSICREWSELVGKRLFDVAERNRKQNNHIMREGEQRIIEQRGKECIELNGRTEETGKRRAYRGAGQM
ncbi:hypothetical protein WR25_18361 [Diploscapter pachys]|uniref:Uncharacterized protein n=1 Tax=Diploscapter pachys TaxID=2018661 RepID=A0A2A2JZA5_9BILA|nr:hypothetical protein WR25_18361 [Diploscapter pachys]